jgi:hypothetical protein
VLSLLGASHAWASWLEQLGVTRNIVSGARRGPSCDQLDIVRKTIIAVGGMEARHRYQMLEDMVRQITTPKAPDPATAPRAHQYT